ncbi:unnamed protein product [Mytilus coruscus]|uniref:Novel STAND NTPase 3 domain-containing protein n=1 Tax=Mytilus coruscus TaxID=42192 RepID=A0A6J8AZT6_MYTCO|nr:unnamed protein product [Mytilus coruscus]
MALEDKHDKVSKYVETLASYSVQQGTNAVGFSDNQPYISVTAPFAPQYNNLPPVSSEILSMMQPISATMLSQPISATVSSQPIYTTVSSQPSHFQSNVANYQQPQTMSFLPPNNPYINVIYSNSNTSSYTKRSSNPVLTRKVEVSAQSDTRIRDSNNRCPIHKAGHTLSDGRGFQKRPFQDRWVVIGEVCLGKVHAPSVINVRKTHVLNDGRHTTFPLCDLNIKVDDVEDLIFVRTPADNKLGLSVQDRQFLELMQRHFRKDENGLWSAPLPFIQPKPQMPNNRYQAWKRAQILESASFLVGDLVRSLSLLRHIAKTLSSATTSLCKGWHICAEKDTPDFIKGTETLIIRQVQKEFFEHEIDSLNTDQHVPKNIAILKLDPILDEHDYECVETDHLVGGFTCPFIMKKRYPDNLLKTGRPIGKDVTFAISETIHIMEKDNTVVLLAVLITIGMAITLIVCVGIADYCSKFFNMNQIIEEQVKNRVEEFKNEYMQYATNEETIPPRIKDIHDQHIKDWRRDEEKFIETEATRQVEKRLRDDNCVLVVGRSGNGKSSILRHLALKVCDENKYQIIPTVIDPSDIHHFYNQKKSQLFVIDDLWGKEKNINAQSVNVWSNKIDDILRLLKTASVFKDKHKSAINVKLLFAVGIDIYNDSIFNGLDSLRSYVCDISNWPLNDQEKLAMIRNYISSKSESKLTQKLKSDKAYFPLLCKIAEGKTAGQIMRLFSNLNDFIKQDILALKETNHLHFCIITLCALLNNSFKEKILNDDYNSSNEREAFENICIEFNLGTQQESAKSKIKEQLENLEGTYVTKTEDYYQIIHTKVYRIAVLVCGQTFVHNFTTYIQSSFIAERFCFESVREDGNKNFIIIEGEDAEKDISTD